MPCLILIFSLSALGIAISSELFGGLKPCVLCIWQRYAYAGIIVAALLGMCFGGNTRNRALFVALAGLGFLVGAGIAGFHVGVEQHWWQGTAECHAPTFDANLSIDELREAMLKTDFVPCDEAAWSYLGISMAGYNGLVSLAMGLLCLGIANATRKLIRP